MFPRARREWFGEEKKKKGNTFVAGKPYDTLFFEFRLLKLKRNWKAGYKINFYFGNERFNFDINIKNIKEDIIIKKRRNRFIISKFSFYSKIIPNHKEQYNSHIKRNNIRSIVWKSRREKRDLSPFRGLSCARDGRDQISLVFARFLEMKSFRSFDPISARTNTEVTPPLWRTRKLTYRGKRNRLIFWSFNVTSVRSTWLPWEWLSSHIRAARGRNTRFTVQYLNQILSIYIPSL